MHIHGQREADGVRVLRQAFTDAADHVRHHVDGLRANVRKAFGQPEAKRDHDGSFTISARLEQRVNRLSVRGTHFAAIIPGDSVVEAVITSGITSTLNLYQSVLIARLILTWFPNPPQAIISPLATICDPYLNLFRGIIPPLGGTIDLSPILAFVVLDLFTGTSAALPCEMPKDHPEQKSASGAL